MLIGLFMVKPVPLPSTSYNTGHEATIEGYDPIPSGDTVVFMGESQVALDSEVDAHVDVDSAPLLPRDQEQSLYQVPSPHPAVELNPPVSSNRERSVGERDGLPDIHGKRLWLTPDFYLVFIIMGICG